MFFGVVLQNFFAWDDKITIKELIEHAALAEELGYNSIWVWDHLILGSRRFYPIYDSLIVLSAVAVNTYKVRLGTSVFLLALRNPVVVAKQVSSLDHLSNGRVILGVGAGWYEKEFKACGVNFKGRGKMLELNIMILKHLLSNETFSGVYNSYEFDNVRLEPKPVQRPHPPIWIGGFGEKTLMRVAKMAEGWISFFHTPDCFAESWRKILNYARECGRKEEKISNCIIIPALIYRNREDGIKAVECFVNRYFNLLNYSKASLESALTGNVNECIRYIEIFKEKGVKELVLVPVFKKTSEIKEKIKELADSIISSF